MSSRTRRERWPQRETIGLQGCPLMIRWTLLANRHFKVLVHHFLPGGEELDAHDHPRGFVTVVLRGHYLDETASGTEVMRAGVIRHRRAEHAHRTVPGPDGAWTIVVMGPPRREWGFWRYGQWWHWRTWERRFEGTFGCPEDRR